MLAVLLAAPLGLAAPPGLTAPPGAEGRKAAGNAGPVKEEELKEWLGFLASDELEGRATFTEGLGIAAQYIATQLKAWGVKPGGENGSYFQRVAVRGVNVTNRSSVTVETNGQTRTFNDGAGIGFQRNVGGKQTLVSDQIEFVGYGLKAPQIGHDDYKDRDVKGKVAVWLGTGPASIQGQQYGRALFSRARYAIEQQAVASIGVGGRGGRGGQQRQGADGSDQPGSEQAAGGGQDRGGQGRGGLSVPARADFTTAQRLDSPVQPAVTAQDEFFDFLFAGQEIKYAEIKQKAANREPLPGFTLKGVKITFNIDADYHVVRTQYTRNVVGIVEGRDASLRNTYVAFGAHYDHVGYAEGEIVKTQSGERRAGAAGRVTAGAIGDRVWNGADDDGSGTVTLMALAKAFALGAKPRRSLIFVWHAGEERGLWGSRYFADYSTVPLDRIVAQINMDMVGRNRDDKAEEANTLYVVGSDRISTELHNLAIDANAGMSKPLTLDFSMNDPTDLEQIYYRSDHYSYAAKGIPIVFLFTGLHADYHANTDSVEKINYEKMARIGQFAHSLAMLVGNLDRAPSRDFRGPRAGKGPSGKLKP
jgi:hypothetical protein